MIKVQLENDLKKVIRELGCQVTDDTFLSIPKNPSFGDYTTNLALQLAKLKSAKGKQSPTEIAREIIKKLKSFDFAQDNFDKIEIAGGGFINFFIKDQELKKNADSLDVLQKIEPPQKVLIEYGHVNPLKEV